MHIDTMTRVQARNFMEQLISTDNLVQQAYMLGTLGYRSFDASALAEEYYGFINLFRDKQQKLPLAKQPITDIVGTGGDGKHSLNISTGSALLAAACGVPMIKHGNRAVSSRCGSGDILEALGLPLMLSPEETVDCFHKMGFAFCYAPNYQPAFLALREVRRALARPTCLNDLGPLLNPAPITCLMLGVNQPKKIELFAEILRKDSIKTALIFHHEGFDEITTLNKSQALLIQNGEVTTLYIDPTEYGFKFGKEEDLIGGEAQYNANHLLAAFSGKSSTYADCLKLNAGIACYLNQLTRDIASGVKKASACIESGQAFQYLNQLRGYHAHKLS